MLLVIDNNYIQFPDVRAKIIKEADDSTIVSWLTLDGTLLGKSEFKSKKDFDWVIKDVNNPDVNDGACNLTILHKLQLLCS